MQLYNAIYMYITWYFWIIVCKVTYFISPTLCYPSNIYSYIICDSSYNHPHSLSLSVLSKYSLSLFPINWHFLHAFVDSFQGSYKNGTESGKFDCCLFSSAFLLIRPLMYIINFMASLCQWRTLYMVPVFFWSYW